jgi:hypothetical protein
MATVEIAGDTPVSARPIHMLGVIEFDWTTTDRRGRVMPPTGLAPVPKNVPKPAVADAVIMYDSWEVTKPAVACVKYQLKGSEAVMQFWYTVPAVVVTPLPMT